MVYVYGSVTANLCLSFFFFFSTAEYGSSKKPGFFPFNLMTFLRLARVRVHRGHTLDASTLGCLTVLYLCLLCARQIRKHFRNVELVYYYWNRSCDVRIFPVRKHTRLSDNGLHKKINGSIGKKSHEIIL